MHGKNQHAKRETLFCKSIMGPELLYLKSCLPRNMFETWVNLSSYTDVCYVFNSEAFYMFFCSKKDTIIYVINSWKLCKNVLALKGHHPLLIKMQKAWLFLSAILLNNHYVEVCKQTASHIQKYSANIKDK